MFKAPFSFEGRIRRSEYAITLLIYVAALFSVVGIFGGFRHEAHNNPGILPLIICLPIIWFALAQAVKRSHDIGNSGWYILIPFYGLWLLFADSRPGANRWGENPKGIN